MRDNIDVKSAAMLACTGGDGMIKILVAEDDAGLNRIVCGTLTANGYSVTGCPDALAALEKTEGEHFDMIVTDIMMPKMDGFAFAEAVQAERDAAIAEAKKRKAAAEERTAAAKRERNK